MPKEKQFTYRDLQRCAERELRLRYRVYERRVDAKEMSRAQADREMELMAEIAAHFRALAVQDEQQEQPSLFPAPSEIIEERRLRLVVSDNGIAVTGDAPQPKLEPQSTPDG